MRNRIRRFVSRVADTILTEIRIWSQVQLARELWPCRGSLRAASSSIRRELLHELQRRESDAFWRTVQGL